MRLRFRMAWARILLLFCFFGGAPLAPFCWVCLVACRLPSLSLRKGFLAGGILFSLSSSRSVGDVSRVFEVAVSHGLCTNPAAVLLFLGRSPSTFLLGLSAGLHATKPFVAQRSPCWGQFSSLSSSGFRRRRFESF